MGVGRRRESPLTCQISTGIYQAASATEERVVGSVCSLQLVTVPTTGIHSSPYATASCAGQSRTSRCRVVRQASHSTRHKCR